VKDWAARLRLLVPMTAPAGRSARVLPSREINTSPGYSLSHTAPMVRPSGSAVGEVFHAVHSHVNFPAQYGVLQFFGEKALVAYFSQSHVQDVITLGADAFNPVAAFGAQAF
jgi:hypothetical protein